MSELTELTDINGEKFLVNLDSAEGVEKSARGAVIWFAWRVRGVEVRETRKEILDRWTINRGNGRGDS